MKHGFMFFFIFLSVFVMFSIPCGLSADDLKCAFCGERIAGQAKIKTKDGKVFCSAQCVKRYMEKTNPVCDVCGKTITGKFYQAGGKNYCSRECLQESLPKCATCGKTITDAYSKLNGKNYCSKECMKDLLPRCSACGKPSSEGAVAADNSFFVCRECASKPRCFSCLMPSECRKLNDGREICPKCYETAVFEDDDARKIFDSVRDDLRKKLGIFTGNPLKMFLSDLKTIQKKSGNKSIDMELGLYEYSADIEVVTTTGAGGKKIVGPERKTNEMFVVYALYGVPKERLAYIFAHEIAHDWLLVNFPGIKEDSVKEGFCEYIAWRYNSLYGRDYLNKRIEANQNEIYGGGFRAVKAVHDNGGFEAVKKYLAQKAPEQKRKNK